MLLFATAASAQTVDVRAFLTLRGTSASGPDSWLAGSYGRFTAGGDDRTDAFAEAQAGVDWTPAPWFLGHVHVLGRLEPSRFEGRRGGLVAAFAQVHTERGANRFALKAGQFFLGTSRENRDDLWTSPYTLSYSALNSWIGEELRPVGIDAEWRHSMDAGTLTIGATAFRNNDTMGTLLAWRGWSIGNRVAVYGEELPLPPLPTLWSNFPNQRDGTIPFEADLDKKTGYSARARFSAAERGSLQWTRIDNRGDRRLYRREYAWDTKLDMLAAEVGRPDKTIAIAEYTRGTTAMGYCQWACVDTDFYAAYGLLSHRFGRNRVSFRYDLFATSDDAYAARYGYSQDEKGRAWTVSWLTDVTDHIRAGAEFTQVAGRHDAAASWWADPKLDGRSLSLEVRYSLK